MKIKTLAFGAAFLLAGASLAGVPAWAEEEENDLLPPDTIPGELSASMTLATDYIYRGISQTSQDPSIQGSIDYGIDTGLYGVGWYAGAWASNIDFDTGAESDAMRGNSGALEIDLYTGVSGDVMDVSWDVGFLQYLYPGSHNALQYEFWEVYGVIGYDFGYFSVGGSLNYSPDFYGGTGDAIYYTAEVSVPVYKSLALNGHFGSQWIDGDGSQSEPWANPGEDYIDWKLGATATILGFDWEVAYVDTDGFTADGVDSNLDGSRFIGSVTASF